MKTKKDIVERDVSDSEAEQLYKKLMQQYDDIQYQSRPERFEEHYLQNSESSGIALLILIMGVGFACWFIATVVA